MVQPGNLYLLDTRLIDRPIEFTFDFLVNRFYDSLHDTTSAVIALKDHVDMRNRDNNPTLFFTNWLKYSMVIANL